MLLSLRKNGLTSSFKEVRVFKEGNCDKGCSSWRMWRCWWVPESKHQKTFEAMITSLKGNGKYYMCFGVFSVLSGSHRAGHGYSSLVCWFPPKKPITSSGHNWARIHIRLIRLWPSSALRTVLWQRDSLRRAWRRVLCELGSPNWQSTNHRHFHSLEPYTRLYSDISWLLGVLKKGGFRKGCRRNSCFLSQ